MSRRARIRRARQRRRQALRSARRWLEHIRVLRRRVEGISPEGVRLIKKYEGFRSKPYQDVVGVWTIGYGSTKGVGPNTLPVTETQAAARLKREVDATYFAAVKALPTFKHLKQHQADALTSFVYNVGVGGIAPNTGMGASLRAKNWKRAADEFLKWNKAGGKELLGLTRRRREERSLFLNG